MSLRSIPERRHAQNSFDKVQKEIATSHSATNPKVLFRYRSCDTSFFYDELEKLLGEKKMYFAPQQLLNDPFDCWPTLSKHINFAEYERNIWPVIRRLMICAEKSKLEAGTISKGTCIQCVRAIKKTSKSDLMHAYETLLDNSRNRWGGEIGVLSLSLSNQNLVMWSMYANNGRGICIELNEANSPDIYSTPVRVLYSEQRPAFDYYGYTALLAMFVPSFLGSFTSQEIGTINSGIEQLNFIYKKNSRWSYEEEIRMVIFTGGGQYHSLKPMNVSRIFVGSKVPSDVKSQIASLVATKSPKTELFTAHVCDSGYQMAFSPWKSC